MNGNTRLPTFVDVNVVPDIFPFAHHTCSTSVQGCLDDRRYLNRMGICNPRLGQGMISDSIYGDGVDQVRLHIAW